MGTREIDSPVQESPIPATPVRFDGSRDSLRRKKLGSYFLESDDRRRAIGGGYTAGGTTPVNIRGKPIADLSKTGGWVAAFFIFGNEMAERMAYFGLSVNMVAFMFYVMHRPFSSSANAVNIFLGISQASSVLGGFLADAYLGRYWTIAIFSTIYLVITFFIGPEVSAHFFKASESDLSQQEVYQFNVPTFGPGVVFDVDYSVRQEQFRFFTEALRVTKLKAYVDQMVMEAENYFSKWGESGEVDLKYELEHLIILTASRCLLGREVRDKLFEDVSALFHDLDNGMLPISVIFPYLPIPAHRQRDQARKKLADIFARIICSRKQTGKAENDMLQCFIDSKYKDGRPTSESEVTGLLIAALFAGQHTSSITSTWTGAYLLRHKEYFSAVLDEQKNLMKKHGNKVDHDILSEMDVLYRCIKEALRLHPPLIMLLRSSHTDFSVTTRDGKEFDIPKGHIVAASPAFANRLPHVFKNPDSYDPDRFAAGREEDKVAGAFSYISFGGGRHGCLGEPFAYLQIKAIWSHLLRNFEFELISPFPEIDWNAMVVGVKGEVMVRYKRRKLVVE